MQEEPCRQTISTLIEAHEEEATQEMPTDNVMNDADARDIVHNLKNLTREVPALCSKVSQLHAEFDMFKSDSKRNITLKLV